MSDWQDHPIVPIGKPRMTQRDRWKQRPVVLRYHAFKDLCREWNVELSDHFRVIFVIPMPKSWSKKKKAAHDGQPHRAKPDIDNVLKALMDAVLEDDSHVWSVRASKRWGYEGKIKILLYC